MRRRLGGLTMGALGVALIALSAPAQAGGCEDGILDAGTDGMNVLVYELCPERLTVGFRNSDVIEEMSCRPDGDIRLWLRADNGRCEAQPASDHDQVYELWEPLAGVGRATAAPVRQLLTCRGGAMNRATIVVPEARDAILETRTGDTTYEQLSRRFVSGCRPSFAWPVSVRTLHSNVRERRSVPAPLVVRSASRRAYRRLPLSRPPT